MKNSFSNSATFHFSLSQSFSVYSKCINEGGGNIVRAREAGEPALSYLFHIYVMKYNNMFYDEDRGVP
jgi:hypothetical protein